MVSNVAKTGFFAITFLFIFSISGVSAINTTDLVVLTPLLPNTTADNLTFTPSYGIYNATTTGIYEENILGYYVNLSTGSSFLAYNNPSTNDLQFSNGNPSTLVHWVYFVDDVSFPYINKWGTGTPSITCRIIGTGEQQCINTNTTGGEFFQLTNHFPQNNTWNMFAYTSDSSYNIIPYMCELGGELQTGTTWTRELRNASQEKAWGGDGTSNNMGAAGAALFYNRVLGGSELQELCDRGINFQNEPEPENVTLTSTQIREYPENYRGYHDAGLTGFPLYNNLANSSSQIRNTSLDRELWEKANIGPARRDIDLRNLCLAENATGGCEWEKLNNTNFQNIDQHRDWVQYHAARGNRVSIIMDAPPRWLANATNECNYAPPPPDFSNFTTCLPSNYSQMGQIVIDYLEYVGCLDEPGLCQLEGDNEPYFGTYFLSNTTAVPETNVCTLRSQRNIEYWNGTMRYIIDTIGRDEIRYISPSYTAASSGSSAINECSRYMMSEFMNAFPINSTYAPDYMNIHEYESSSSCLLGEKIIAAQNNLTAGGYGDWWQITESECNNAVVNSNDILGANLLTRAWMTGLLNTSLSTHMFYVWSSLNVNAETYQAFSPPSLDNFIKGSYYSMNTTKWLPEGSNVYNCVSDVDNFNCLYVEKNNVGYLLYTINVNDSVVVDYLHPPTEKNITNITRLENGIYPEQTYSVIDGLGVNLTFSGLEVSLLEITYENLNISYNSTMPSSVNITTVQGNPAVFSVSVNNPSDLILYYSWLIDGVNATSLYGSTSIETNFLQGDYEIQSIVYSAANQISYNWNLDVMPPDCIVLNEGYGALLRIILVVSVLLVAFALLQLFNVVDTEVSSIMLVAQAVAAFVIASSVLLPLVKDYCLV